jgi:hypothetical protein
MEDDIENEEMEGPVVGYTCPNCSFDTDMAHCDSCQGVLKYDHHIGGDVHCTGCGREINYITCRKCEYEFSL